MSIISVGALAVAAAVFVVLLRPKNGEIALLLGAACSVAILALVFSQASAVLDTVAKIIAAADISSSYVAVLLKAVGICLVTEFAVNTCKDAGSQSLACNVSLAGKLMVTVAALPLYIDILNSVVSRVKG
ncbi:MAG: hypothetical protein IIY79_01605 [Ruminococcus sp.]|nr:hypothetical protein [Ruminococcus sp.]